MLNLHEKLRNDVNFLGGTLGEVLREQVGEDFFHTVEETRRIAKDAHKSASIDKSAIRAKLNEIPFSQSRDLGRAFSFFLSLANTAELYHRSRMHSSEETINPLSASEAELDGAFEKLKLAGISETKIIETISSMKIDLVFTAHPTELKRQTIIDKMNHIARLLGKRDREQMNDWELSEWKKNIKREITSIWLTDEVRRRKPSPDEEARHGLRPLNTVLWRQVPQFFRRLSATMEKHFNESLPLTATPLCFSSWMGGDRDGNPNVTAEVTERVIWENRATIADLYANEFSKLAAGFAFERGSTALESRTNCTSEPYRALLRPMVSRFRATVRYYKALLENKTCNPSIAAKRIRNASEILEPLELIYNSLISTNGSLIADGRLTDVIRRVHLFGAQYVKLDIRQESDAHTLALDWLLAKNHKDGYTKLLEPERISLLKEIIHQPKKLQIPRLEEAEPVVAEVLRTFQMIARNEPENFGSYIISMARSGSDVLAVIALQKIFSVPQLIPVAPLFETLSDLENAPKAMTALFDDSDYLKIVGSTQEVMLGYSDSAKDAGRVASAWAVYRAQEQLVELSAKHNLKLTFFHGRGGTISRGGGPIFSALRALPPGSIQGSVRITEQGEMIQNHFGLPGVANQTLELYFTASLLSTLIPEDAPTAEMREVIQRVSNASCEHFRTIVRERPEFIDYFRELTPEIEMQYLNVGSRPTRRNKTGGVSSLRAIPWVFAWTQVRLMLPVWLGVGVGLQSAIEAYGSEKLSQLYIDCSFFRTLIDLVEMAMAKADIKISRVYEDFLVAPAHKDFGAEMHREFRNCVATINTITKQTKLLERKPWILDSLAVRNPYVDPLNLLQAATLRRFRDNTANEQDMDILLVTFNGIVAGMKNAG